ncbi:MAG TPA: decaprenyl-phosphate phosphoribosyltransferase [Candidatus Hydrogenedentes bacterium]|nr:decaprenyl-phosphate phosphoribosyltransferase [Candidatus Hydrogenedentota bacterium]HOL76843.1 decaprenyl-phosphate phosphoribosyltransferase [Candidatus Hydrogenedentota bacterium]HPO86215.1 decaprenyl-phosphate phosphoribosyltransferase [Candidatus Hydrogenedentota bacterium]
MNKRQKTAPHRVKHRTTKRQTWRALIKALRIHQWIKNGFVFAAPVFAKEITQPHQLMATTYTFVAFCLASSATYLFNDILDLEEDKLHPEKRLRPLASGEIPIHTAVLAANGLAILSVVLSASLVSIETAGIIAVYLAINTLYSMFFKHIVILDVMFIAVGFLLRIFAGAAATEVPPSYWLLLCTMNISLFLGFAKRRFEVIALEDNAVNHRRVLEHYSIGFLDQMISIVTAATVVCYILYTVDERTVSVFHTRLLVATVPFVLYGMFRYLYLAYHRQGGGNPSRALLTDVPLLLTVALWVGSCLLIIYFGEHLAKGLPW